MSARDFKKLLQFNSDVKNLLEKRIDQIKGQVKSDFAGDKHTYGSRLSKKYEEDMRSKFSPKIVMDAIEKALKELISKPELVF